MIYIFIIVIIVIFLYFSAKGTANLKNVSKHGGLKNKYKTLIDLIMSRNPFYQLNEINANNLELTNTGIKFSFIEVDKKLIITWIWNSFTSGQTHQLLWKFDVYEDQIKMYERIDRDMGVQNFIDDGMTKEQAEDFFVIHRCQNKEERDSLIEDFGAKYPDLLSNLKDE